MNYLLWVLASVSGPLLVVVAGVTAYIAVRALRAAQVTAQETRRSVDTLAMSIRVDVTLRLDDQLNRPAMLRARVARRIVPFRRLGSRLVFRRADLKAFIAALEGCAVEEALANMGSRYPG